MFSRIWNWLKNLFKIKKPTNDIAKKFLRNKLSKDKSAVAQAFKKKMKEVLLRKELGLSISKSDEKLLNIYENYFFNAERNQRIYTPKSHWIRWVEYCPKKKIVFIAMSKKGGYKVYPFFNVPKTKFVLLYTYRGKFMWDYFGKHYSLNPKNWIRGIVRR